MYKKTNLILSLIILLATFLPQGSGMAAGTTVTIATDTVNVRGGPGLSYPLVAQGHRGETYTVVSEKDDWIEIKLSFGRTGWLVNWLVTKTGEKTASAASSDPQFSNGSNATSTTDQLRIRSGPGTSFRIVGILNTGQAVTIQDQNEYWYKITSSSGDGWVVKDFIKISSTGEKSSQKEDSTTSSTGVVSGDTLNVREEPSTSSPIEGKLTNGTIVVILKKQDDWYQINYGSLKGWVSASFIETDSSSSQQPAVKDTGTIGTVTASSLNVRSGSALSNTIIGTVTQGEQFMILEEKNSWAKIEYKKGSFGWVAGWFLTKSADKNQTDSPSTESTVTILHNGTNIRNGPSVQNDVLTRANEGDTFPIQGVSDNWYKIKLKNGTIGYVAGWIVSVNGSAPQIEKSGVESYLKNKIIVIDPGHGGGDNGATGANGTLEKELTLRTAKLLYDKLQASGAKVYLTRSNDSFIPLPSRVSTAHTYNADAFISIHYDSNIDASVRGSTGYYYQSYQQELAETVYASTVGQTGLRNRGVRFGDFHVIRENRQKATLIELGYLSNPQEEVTLKTGLFQENAATGLYNGLARFFKEN